MKVQVRNFVGVERADIEVDGIALVAGHNWSGKSSLIQATCAALTGDFLVRGLDVKKEAGVLVRSGAEKGGVVIESEDGKITMAWPACQPVAKGKPPSGHPYVVGLKSVADLKPKDRGNVFMELLKAEPTKEDFVQALADVGITKEESVAKIWAKVEEQGWDAAYEFFKTRGAALKRQWGDVTGSDWGAKKGEDWLPEGFDTDDDQSLEEFDKALARARQRRDDAIANAAVSQERLNQLKERADSVQRHIDEAQRITEEIAEKERKLREFVEERDKLPIVDEPADPILCPHCNGHLVIRRPSVHTYSVEKAPEAKKLSEKAVKDVRLQRASLDGNITTLEAEISTLRARKLAEEEFRRAAEKAADDYNESVQKNGDPEAVEQATKTVGATENLRDAKIRYDKARAAHRNIVGNQKVIDILSADGVRKTKVQRVLDEINAELDALTTPQKLPQVHVEPDLGLSLRGRSYRWLSESEKWLADVVLRVALAQRGLADLITLDRFDVLQPQLRPGVLRLLRTAGVKALVGMMAKEPAAVPALAKAKIGRNYWLDGGVASETPWTEQPEQAA